MKRTSTHGFTIVELLIVIIVIGILATLVLIAYNNVQAQAHASAAKNDLEQVAKQLGVYKTTSGGGMSYPVDASSLKYSSGTSLQYSVDNTVSPATYCVTATNGTQSFFVSSSDQNPTSGGCPGDGVGGAAAVTNLVTIPGFENGSKTGVGYNNASIVSNGVSGLAAHSGSYGLRSAILTTTSMSNVGPYLQVTGMDVDQPYTASVWVRASRAYQFHIQAERRDASGSNIGYITSSDVTLSPNTWTRLVVQVPWKTAMDRMTFCVYSATNSWVAGDTVDFDDFMVTAGSTVYNYADGSSPNWIWTGTPNNSTSKGPAL